MLSEGIVELPHSAHGDQRPFPAAQPTWPDSSVLAPGG